MSEKQVFVFLADGFEEMEAVAPVDFLRRAGVKVTTASIMGRRQVNGSHGVPYVADVLAEEADFSAADLVILPGGMPGAKYLEESALVKEQCLRLAKTGMVAAICAAPGALGAFGLLQGKRATVYPGLEHRLIGAVATGEKVVVDGNIVTGQAPGAAIPFALTLVRLLCGEAAMQSVAEDLVL